MTVAMPDLVPAATSRVVLIDVSRLTEDAPRDGWIDFILPGDLRVPMGGQIIAASTKRVELINGKGQIRLPVISSAVKDDAGDGWYIIVRKSWLSEPYPIRVPAGTGSINLADIAPAVVLPKDVEWALRTASITVKEGNAGGSVSLAGGNLAINLTVPRGLPGPGAVATDEAVAALTDATNTKTKTALDAQYQRGINPVAYSIVGDGKADDTAAWNALLKAIPAGSTVTADGTYKLSGPVIATKPVTIKGGTWLGPTTGNALIVRSSDVTLDGLTITASKGDPDAGSTIIWGDGSQSSPVRRLTIRGVKTTGGKYGAIWLDWPADFLIEDCTLDDFQYVGIMALSARGGLIRGNTVRNPLMGGTLTNAYCIAVSDRTNDIAGRSDSVVVDANYCDGAKKWEGIDTHSGINIRITNNYVINARTGIAVVPGNSARTVAPENVVVTGNHVVRGSGDNDKAGIQMIGVLDGPAVTGSVMGNTIRGYATDLIVAYHDYTRLIVDTAATDASDRLSPHRQQWREWNALTSVTVTNGAGSTNLTFPDGWFTTTPVVQATKQSSVGARCVPYVADVTATGCRVGLYDPTEKSSAATTVIVAVRVTQANPRNGGGTAGI